MESNNKRLYYQLYMDIKEKILSNFYKKNSKLESIRALAKRLQISTTTVEKAYNQLSVEGYIKSIARSGYIVQDISSLETSKHKTSIEAIEEDVKYNTSLTKDLFDIKLYKRMTNKVFNYYPNSLYHACNPRGEYELREEIRKYILKERAVSCDVNQIIVGPGIQSLLNILLSIHKGQSVAYLYPEFKKAMTIFRAYQYQLKGRVTTKDIESLQADLLYISPSNTYPTGEILSRQERNDMISWARRNHSYIIEDDYNFFIRYNSYTIPSMYSIDGGHNVIYMGSFNKTILPSIRISYMVLPLPLYKLYKEVYKNFSQGVSKLEQLSVALFMKEGLYQRHTKKLYHSYKEKNSQLLNALALYSDHTFSVRSTDSNLHVVIDFHHKKHYLNFIENLEENHLDYEAIKGKNSVIFPYSGIDTNNLNQVLSQLFNHKKENTHYKS